MAIWIGTSGYNYPEWKGSFYPEKMPASKMLSYYSARFPTVEINNTFYRMPTPAAVAGWRDGTPENFRLTLKAPKAITHIKRLRDCDELLKVFVDTAAALATKQGVLLFQLPPFMKKDVALLESFLQSFPRGVPAAFEFRHPSWFDDAVYQCLRNYQTALCVADSEKLTTPVEITTDYAYFRLRDEGYGPDDIARWAEVIREKTAAAKDVYVYFKHEEEGKGPDFGKRMMEIFGEACVSPQANA